VTRMVGGGVRGRCFASLLRQTTRIPKPKLKQKVSTVLKYPGPRGSILRFHAMPIELPTTTVKPPQIDAFFDEPFSVFLRGVMPCVSSNIVQ
jgi:hypothetical protein